MWNRLERMIGAVAPGVALRREASRRALRRLEQGGGRSGYEGASRGRRTERWLARQTDANAAMTGALGTLRARSRDLVRNNAWASAGVDVIESWTVGTGIMGAPPKNVSGAKQLAELWKEWSETTACDADGDLDLAGLMGVGMRTVAESGDVLVRRRTRRDADGLPVPLQLQLLEPDHLDLNRVTADNGNQVIHGIEYDAIGKKVAFWLYPDHPGSDRPNTRHVSVRVPAGEVLHSFRTLRVGQVQGIPWLTPALIRLRDLDEFEDANLLRMVLAGAFGAFVKRVGEPDTDDGDPFDAIEDLQPGAVQYLNAGEDVVFPTLPNVTGVDTYTASQLRAIAAALQVPYEALTGDLSKVNFSSGRMGFNAFERRILMHQRMLRLQLLDPIARWFVEAAAAVGATRLDEARKARWVWTPPARMILDPQVEGQADYEAVRNGVKTPSELLRARGKDPEAHWEEYAEDMERLDAMGIVLDLDPRKSAAPGASSNAGAKASPTNSDEENAEESEELEEDSSD
jgi:lambda family phage portal protein